MFTQRHYEEIAVRLVQCRNMMERIFVFDHGTATMVRPIHDYYVATFAEMFEADNPRFKRDKFERACEA